MHLSVHPCLHVIGLSSPSHMASSVQDELAHAAKERAVQELEEKMHAALDISLVCARGAGLMPA